MNRERKIDVMPGKYSVLDTEFGSMRDRFETEMRHVEEEMRRLRHEFEGHTPSQASPLSDNRSTSYHQQEQSRGYGSSALESGALSQANSDRFGHDSFTRPDMMTVKPTYDPYLENLKSPLIKDESDGKTLRLRFNVALYKPEEVTVKTVDNKLLVHAKHEEKSPQRSVFREYNQEFLLPSRTNPELISSTLSTDGVLTVEAPLPQMAIQR